jgi:hypothetical protein
MLSVKKIFKNYNKIYLGESIESTNNHNTNKTTLKKYITNKTIKTEINRNQFYLQPKIGIFTNGNGLTPERVKLLLNDAVEVENKTFGKL